MHSTLFYFFCIRIASYGFVIDFCLIVECAYRHKIIITWWEKSVLLVREEERSYQKLCDLDFLRKKPLLKRQKTIIEKILYRNSL